MTRKIGALGVAALLLLVSLLSACGDSATSTTQGFTPLAGGGATTPTGAASGNGGATTPNTSGSPASGTAAAGGQGNLGGPAIAVLYMNSVATQLGIPVTPGAGFGGGNGTPGAGGGFGGIGNMTDDQLNQAVQSGRLTQQQADCIRTARAGNTGTPTPGALAQCGFGGGNRTPNGTPDPNRTPNPNRTPGAGGFGRGFGNAFAGSADALAKALNLSKDDLKAQLQAGKTLTDIATAQKVDIQTVKDAITTNAQTNLDAEVKAGTIQQTQADNTLSRLKADLDTIVKTKVNGG